MADRSSGVAWGSAATSARDRHRSVPAITANPSASSTSTASASKAAAARRRTCSARSRAAPSTAAPPTGMEREPPVPDPVGVWSVSPWRTRTMDRGELQVPGDQLA